MSSVDYSHDTRVVMTLDAGGTNLRFSAMRGDKAVVPDVVMSSSGDNLNRCLAKIVDGFAQVKGKCPAPPVAISFAFPGPADYPNGVIGDLGNLPCFRGGVALGPMLEEKFGVPVFINNDGDLFAYGEAIAGFLPYVNGLLENAGSPKRYKNLLGVTLGTGFGGGIVRDGELFIGDNSMAGEIWLLRNKIHPLVNAEEGASIRAVRRVYAKQVGIPVEEAPDPCAIERIVFGKDQDKSLAAIEAYRRLGEVVGDAMANALTLIDGLAVIGGGISKGYQLFLPTLVDELNSVYIVSHGNILRRLTPVAFNLEDPAQRETFLLGKSHEIPVPGGFRKIKYDPLPRIGVGVSRLGTSEAMAVGAYAFALRKMDGQIKMNK
jgi:glucokinase